MTNRILHVVHPAPLRRMHPRAKRPSIAWTQCVTPVRLKDADPTDFTTVARGRMDLCPFFEIKVDSQGALWHALRPAGLDSTSPYNPVEVAEYLESGLDETNTSLLRSLGGTPLAAAWGRKVTRGSAEAPRSHVVFDGREDAARQAREFFENDILVAGDEVLVRGSGVFLEALHRNHGYENWWYLQVRDHTQGELGRFYSLDRIADALAFEFDGNPPREDQEIDLGGIEFLAPFDSGLDDVRFTLNTRPGAMHALMARYLDRWSGAQANWLLDNPSFALGDRLDRLALWAMKGATGQVELADALLVIEAVDDVIGAACGFSEEHVGGVLTAHIRKDQRQFEAYMLPRLREAGLVPDNREDDETVLAGLGPSTIP